RLYEGRAVVRLVSPLARGADRLVAERALALKYELCCPIPFARADYEKTFESNDDLIDTSTRAEVAAAIRAEPSFDVLLSQGSRDGDVPLFELDGSHADQAATDDAYLACTRVVVQQSDLLIVVWDQKRLGKRGGTESGVDEARRLGVPVLQIDPANPMAWTITKPGTSLPEGQPKPASGSVNSLMEVVASILRLPPGEAEKSDHSEGAEHQGDGTRQAKGHGKTDDHDKLNIFTYYRERRRRFRFAIFWLLFRGCLTVPLAPSRETWAHLKNLVRIPFSILSRDFEQGAIKEWPTDSPSPLGKLIDRLRAPYAWADGLAVRCADANRSAFVAMYLLASIAVILAVLPLATGWVNDHNHPGTLAAGWAEIVTLLTILTIYIFNKRWLWHPRWLEYRLMAEFFRHQRLMMPFGGEKLFPGPPAHLDDYGHPGASWIAWYVRAYERAIGLPIARVDQAYLEEAYGDVTKVLADQISFHQASVRRCHMLEHRIHAIGLFLISLCLVACLFHVIVHHLHLEWFSPGVLHTFSFVTAAFPAIGAALEGIVNQGEFRRVARRSKAMASHLASIKAKADGLQKDKAPPLTRASVSDIASRTASAMINELLDWRVVFIDRKPAPPA
ncbi:MAG: hypothetical protein JNL80_17405, partial [Phycisphaerae bacterium]|nr:hypothetical protein [Phycisphaerae bacterium]